MNLETRIYELESEINQLKKIVKESGITLIDECDPKIRAEITMKNGVFLLEKITTTTTETSELILKDNN